eukprot:8413676-Alexandrium_andersonii.AAC.1
MPGSAEGLACVCACDGGFPARARCRAAGGPGLRARAVRAVQLLKPREGARGGRLQECRCPDVL